MDAAEQKQLNRKRRERRLRAWLTTLSWSTPVIAFGGFFSIWHHISAAVNATPKNEAHAASAPSGTSQNPILFKMGSSSSQVRLIQEQLLQLGYFNHQFTNYYGSVTTQAVRTFQAANSLNQTGEVDSKTLSAIQQAVKDAQTTKLAQNQNTQDGTGVTGSNDGFNSSSGDTGNAGISQQTTPPSTISSAS